MTCAPSKNSHQPEHPPSLFRVFAVRMKKTWVLSYPLSTQRRLWSDLADAQAYLSLRWAHRSFCWFCCAGAQIVFKTKEKLFTTAQYQATRGHLRFLDQFHGENAFSNRAINNIRAAAWQNQWNDMCAQRILSSAWMPSLIRVFAVRSVDS